jgi:hypothetical protein
MRRRCRGGSDDDGLADVDLRVPVAALLHAHLLRDADVDRDIPEVAIGDALLDDGQIAAGHVVVVAVDDDRARRRRLRRDRRRRCCRRSRRCRGNRRRGWRRMRFRRVVAHLHQQDDADPDVRPVVTQELDKGVGRDGHGLAVLAHVLAQVALAEPVRQDHAHRVGLRALALAERLHAMAAAVRVGHDGGMGQRRADAAQAHELFHRREVGRGEAALADELGAVVHDAQVLPLAERRHRRARLAAAVAEDGRGGGNRRACAEIGWPGMYHGRNEHRQHETGDAEEGSHPSLLSDRKLCEMVSRRPRSG